MEIVMKNQKNRHRLADYCFDIRAKDNLFDKADMTCISFAIKNGDMV